jgi:hypothetical protein
MHRITLPDGTTRQSKFLRFTRTTAYFMISTGGILLLFSDILGLAYGPLATYMSWFLAIGGFLAALGSASLRWWGEFCGLPLVSPAFVVLGVLVYRAGHDSAPYISAANFCLLTAFGVLVLVRWRVVLSIYRVALHTARGRKMT